jgi:hypothetical protein
MTRFTRVLVVAAFVAACSESPLPPPPSGTPPEPPAPPNSLTLRLQGPSSDDGALLLELKGPGLGAVTPADSTAMFSSEMISDSVLRVAIVGSVSNRAILYVNLTNRTDVSAYRATILDITNSSGQPRENLTPYSIRIIAQ